MIGSTRRVAVHAYGAPCDMRKSFDTLAAIAVQQMRQELLSGDVFLFVGVADHPEARKFDHGRPDFPDSARSALIRAA